MLGSNIIFSLLIIIVGTFIRDDVRSKKTFCILIAIVLILQNALRPVEMSLDVGNDTYGYLLQYNSIAQESLRSLIQNFSFIGADYASRDAGFPIFVKLTQYISSSFAFFLFVVAIIVVVPIVLIIYKMSPSKSGIVTACVIYESLFAHFFETAIRQTIVMGLLFFAVNWILKRQEWKFILAVLLASTIHSSAWIFLPLAFVYYVKDSRRILLLMLLAAPFIMYYAKDIVAMVGSDTMYSSYAVDSDDNLGTPVFSALIFLIGIGMFYMSKRIQVMYPSCANVLILAIGSSVILTPSSWIDSNFIRIVFYYALFITVAVPCCIEALWYNDAQSMSRGYMFVNCLLLVLMLR